MKEVTPIPAKPAVPAPTPPKPKTVQSSVLAKPGDIITFGPCQWRVLETEDDKGYARIITVDIIEQRPYHRSILSSHIGIEWDKCSLRDYLYAWSEKSFSSWDKNHRLIINTEGTIALLTAQEAEKYLPDPKDRVAKLNGQVEKWWLRIEGKAKAAATVGCDGAIAPPGSTADSYIGHELGVRPVIWIRL